MLDLKREALARASALAGPAADHRLDHLDHPGRRPRRARSSIPERFLNAHWLNPAYLVPLVELSPGAHTDPAVTARLKALLEGDRQGAGRLRARGPATSCRASRRSAMNEAARMVEEGVASAEEIDKAIKYGFGFRFAVLGMLEFIDWGGGDILYYASRYLTKALGNERYAAPEIVERNMREGRIGLDHAQGFLDYENLDVEAYRRERLKAFVAMLTCRLPECWWCVRRVPQAFIAAAKRCATSSERSARVGSAMEAADAVSCALSALRRPVRALTRTRPAARRRAPRRCCRS